MFNRDSLSKCRLVTNKRRTMLGFITTPYGQNGVLMFGIKNVEGVDTVYSTEVLPQNMVDVEGPKDLSWIRDNNKTLIEEMKADIITRETALRTRKASLDKVSKMKVVNSKKTIDKVIAETEEYEESIKSGYLVSIRNNLVGVPSRCCPYFYLTEDDLNQFIIGDIVKVKFRDGSKVASKYKGKTIEFVVNNFLEYNWRRPTKRLALVPLEDGWTKRDVLILDDYDRFECLMIDLFPCNRRPFNGWRSKEVSIKKVGQVEQMPKTGDTKPTLSMLRARTQGEILIRKVIDYKGDRTCLTTSDVGKRGDMPGMLVFDYKIYTSTDKKGAISFLKNRIIEIEKGIAELKEKIKDTEEFVAGIKYFEDLNFFDMKRGK